MPRDNDNRLCVIDMWLVLALLRCPLNLCIYLARCSNRVSFNGLLYEVPSERWMFIQST